MLTRSRAKSIGWAVILAVSFALTIALSFRVNAVRSQVRLTERHIAALKSEQNLLETEFETRANQQQLTALNEVEFGYQAPTAGQYLENERQLAALGKPRAVDAPPMIRVAAAEPAPAGSSMLPAFVNPLTGKALGQAGEPASSESKRSARAAKPALAERGAANLADRLSHVEQLAHVEKQPKVIANAGATKLLKAEPKVAAKAKGKPAAKSEPTVLAKLAKSAAKPSAPTAKPPVVRLAANTGPADAASKAIVRKAAAPRIGIRPHGHGERVALD